MNTLFCGISGIFLESNRRCPYNFKILNFDKINSIAYKRVRISIIEALVNYSKSVKVCEFRKPTLSTLFQLGHK